MTTDRFSFLRRPALSLAAGLAVVAALAWLVLAGGTAKRTEGERAGSPYGRPRWCIRSAWSDAWNRGAW